jgi:hypothetical protein
LPAEIWKLGEATMQSGRQFTGRPAELVEQTKALRERFAQLASDPKPSQPVALTGPAQELLRNIGRVLGLRALSSPEAKAGLDLFNHLAVAACAAPLHPGLDPQTAVLDLDTVADLLQALEPSSTASDAAIEPAPGRKRGPKPDLQTLRRFAEVVAPYGKKWKTHADEIYQKLDEARIPVPTTWPKRKDPRVQTWEDGSCFLDRAALQALEYRYEKAKEHFPETLATPAAPE